MATDRREGEKEVAEAKPAPFVARACLLAGCMAWDGAGGCRLIPAGAEASGFDARLREAAPLLYGTLLDLVRVMEERAWECDACADLWDYAAEVRRSSRRARRGAAEGGVKADGESV